MPSDTNVTISLRTARVIQGSTGNKKFCGMPIASVVGNLLTAPAFADWTTFTAQLLQPLNDTAMLARWKPCVWSPARPTDRADVIDAFVQPEVRVLRRRQYGKGV